MNALRKRWLIAPLLAVGLVAGTVAGFLARGRAAVRVRLETSPPAASAYLNGEYVGVTPLTVEDIGWGPGVLRLEHRERATWRGVLLAEEMAGSWPKRWRLAAFGGELRKGVELPPRLTASLTVTSSPDAAAVEVDGEPVGTTPLRLENLRPGLRTVRLSLPQHTDAAEEIFVEDGARAALHFDLASEIFSVLRASIEQDPTNLHNYVDLAREHVVRGHHDEAVPLLWKAHELLASGKATAGFQDDRLLVRFYNECFQMLMRGLDYPPENSLPLRKACYEILQAGQKAFPNENNIRNLLRRAERP